MRIQLGNRKVGDGCPCYVIAEIGINHNGDLGLTKRLILSAKQCGCDAVKFQKRTVDVVYSAEELAKPRETPFGTTNGDLKRRLEFGVREYAEIDSYCREVGIQWFASCWDEGAVNDIARFDVPCFKIASASLTDHRLCAYTACVGRPLMVSTGMSTLEQVEGCVSTLEQYQLDKAILHCVSTYPCENADINLLCIPELRNRFGWVTGYSGHEQGIATSVAAVALGAQIVERHFTLDRTMFGSDQAASLEPPGMARMVRDIRAVETAMGDGLKRVLPAESQAAAKLRRVA